MPGPRGGGGVQAGPFLQEYLRGHRGHRLRRTERQWVETAARAGDVGQTGRLVGELVPELARVEATVRRVLEDPVAYGLVPPE